MNRRYRDHQLAHGIVHGYLWTIVGIVLTCGPLRYREYGWEVFPVLWGNRYWINGLWDRLDWLDYELVIETMPN